MKSYGLFSCLAGLSVLAASPLVAADLPLSPSTPDFTGSFVGVTYNSSTMALQASGLTSDYEGGSGPWMDFGPYTLTATITSAGILTGGTLTIDGAVGSGPDPDTLLTASLVTGASGTAFGYGDGGNQIFQFKFQVSGGEAPIVNDFGGLGALGGIILDAKFNGSSGDHPFTGSWTGSFDSSMTQNGTMDSFSVSATPEPSSLALLALAGIGCVVAARCRRQRIGSGPA